MRPSNKIILIVACFIFLLLGLVTAAIGPVLPELAQHAGVTLSKIGTVFTAIFAGALVAQTLVGPIGDRVGHQRIILAGLVLVLIGLLGIGFSRSLPVTLLFALLTGFGHGGIDLGGNVLIATAFNGRSVSALNLLNLFFGLGAFAGPAFVSLSLNLWETGLPALWLCAVMILVSVRLLVGIKTDAHHSASRLVASGPSPARRSVYRSPLLWIVGLLILVYVGTENGIGGWMTTYVQNTTGTAIEKAVLVTAGFWLALTVGRMISSGLGLRVSPLKILFGTLIGAVIGGSLLAAAVGNLPVTVGAVLLIGLSFGAVFPTAVALITGQFETEPGKAVGVVAAMGSIGGAIIPWTQGALMETVSSAASARFILGAILFMLALMVLTRLRLAAQSRLSVPQSADQ